VANIDKNTGLKIHGPLLGCKMYSMSAAYAQALYIGDPMRHDGTSIVIATAGTGNAILGAALGFFTSEFAPLTYSYHPSATAGTNFVLIADNPRQLYSMQEDSVASNNALTDIGGDVNIINNDGGSTTSGLSGWEIVSGAGGNTAGDQMRIIDIERRQGNAVGSKCRWVVRINNHQGNAGIVGVGI
jgi:hypothetical protein